MIIGNTYYNDDTIFSKKINVIYEKLRKIRISPAKYFIFENDFYGDLYCITNNYIKTIRGKENINSNKNSFFYKEELMKQFIQQYNINNYFYEYNVIFALDIETSGGIEKSFKIYEMLFKLNISDYSSYEKLINKSEIIDKKKKELENKYVFNNTLRLDIL